MGSKPSVVLYVRVTPEQHAKVAHLAETQDRTIAATVRRLIDRAQ